MLSLTLRQLEVLEAVVRFGGFGAASSRLDISQASVSAHITSLESQVGTPVFERRPGRRPTLTEAGELVLRHARQILASARALEQSLDQSARREETRIVFSCQRSLARRMQADLAKFASQNRGIELVLRIGTIEDVINDIRSGTADIGQFVSYDPVTEVSSHILSRTRLVVVAAPSHPLAGAKRIAPSVLATFPFVGPPPSMFGRAVRQVLHNAGVPDVNVVAQTNEYTPLRELVLAGVGLTCSFWTSVEQDVKSGRLALLDVDSEPMMVDVRIAQTEHRALPPEAEPFLAFLRTDPAGSAPPSG
ncbi:LysR family transcriptional regulator [Aquibium sp. LZ166]|uniref:LysR family transcriptional regulator n=1 Tax=Aquibium pacificus TaxID=3153579 RepID=A0ABV3SI94_9HYPH